MHIARTLVAILLAWAVAAVALAQQATLEQQLDDAKFRFDLVLAETLLPQFQQSAQDASGEALGLDYASTALLVAELRRGEFENVELDQQARRDQGAAIDAAAHEGLAALTGLSESSERYRMEADLLSTMIRSKFKGMKYQPRVERAVARALELDDKNANAWVSQSRRPLFASAKHGGDSAIALLYLNRALAVNPDHVQALLFRGAAHTKLGNPLLAEADWSRAVALNPNTESARDRLLTIEMPFD